MIGIIIHRVNRGWFLKKNGKSFYLFYFLNTVTHYVTLLIFEEKWEVAWVLRLEYLVFREAKTRFENWPASSVHTNSFLLDFCTSFFYVWKLSKKFRFFKFEFLRQKFFLGRNNFVKSGIRQAMVTKSNSNRFGSRWQKPILHRSLLAWCPKTSFWHRRFSWKITKRSQSYF